jgi:hypothetical protein
MAASLLAFLGTVIAALIGATGVFVGKKLEVRATRKMQHEDVQSTTLAVALEVLQGELERKSGEVEGLNQQIERQAKDIDDLRVSNWFVLQHLLDVHRHFAEGNPPPPPPIPEKLLSYMREG